MKRADARDRRSELAMNARDRSNGRSWLLTVGAKRQSPRPLTQSPQAPQSAMSPAPAPRTTLLTQAAGVGSMAQVISSDTRTSDAVPTA